MDEQRELQGAITGLFVGRTRQVAIADALEPTSFPKFSSTGPLFLGQNGFEGNEIGTSRRLGLHNHAVYMFCEDHHRHFERVLGRAYERGAFAENISYLGPDEWELRIGDCLHMGEAVIEIVSPRIPCYKMAYFLGADASFPSFFSASGKTGFYCRVRKTGQVWPDSPFRIVQSDPANASVADLNAVLTAGKIDADLADRVLGSPALLPEVRALVEDRIRKVSPDVHVRPQSVTILSKVQEAEGVVSLTFDMDLSPTGRPKAGQFVTFGVKDDSGTEHFRCYSLSGGPFATGDSGPWRITVKCEADSANAFSVSAWVHDRLSVGDICTVYPPAGDFHLPDDLPNEVLLMAGGIGITPVVALLKVLRERAYAGSVVLVYAVQTRADLAFMEEITQLAGAMKNVSCHLFVTREQEDGAGAPAHARFARPDLNAMVRDFSDQGHIFVCGPKSMIEDVRDACLRMGRANDRLHYELFTGDGTLDYAGNPAEAARVKLMNDNCEGTWTNADGPLLDWIEKTTSHRPVAACRSGICRTCTASLAKGSVAYPASISPPAPTEVLLCCAKPVTDVEIYLLEEKPDALAV